MRTKTLLNIFTGLGVVTIALSAPWWGIINVGAVETTSR